MLSVPTRYQHFLEEDDPTPRRGSHKPDWRQAKRIDAARSRRVEKAAREVDFQLNDDMSYEELRTLVYNEMRRHYSSTGRNIQPFEQVADTTMHRWMVNHIRHKNTEYNSALMYREKAADYDPALYREHVRRRVLGLISDRYPVLLEECRRQREESSREPKS